MLRSGAVGITLVSNVSLFRRQEVSAMPRSVYRALTLALLFALSSLATPLAAAPPENKAGGNKAGSELKAGADGLDVGVSGRIDVGISFGDARRLAEQHGLTGAKPLPPGIRKNLARGKPMPPGIQKTRMPDGFISQLPHYAGHEWRQAGGDLVLVASGSLVISDILEGVFD